jgi:hypothetical protein
VIAARTGATCFVGSGDGIGARRAGGAAPCVERAGFDVLERDTDVLRRADFGAFDLERTFDDRAGFAALATGRRDERRALTLRRDAAFNCFPLPLELQKLRHARHPLPRSTSLQR